MSRIKVIGFDTLREAECFMAALDWVNDSAIVVLDYASDGSWVLLEDEDSQGEDRQQHW